MSNSLDHVTVHTSLKGDSMSESSRNYETTSQLILKIHYCPAASIGRPVASTNRSSALFRFSLRKQWVSWNGALSCGHIACVFVCECTAMDPISLNIKNAQRQPYRISSSLKCFAVCVCKRNGDVKSLSQQYWFNCMDYVLQCWHTPCPKFQWNMCTCIPAWKCVLQR